MIIVLLPAKGDVAFGIRVLNDAELKRQLDIAVHVYLVKKRRAEKEGSNA